MKYRAFGNTGWDVSEVAIGTWQVGGGWGKAFDEGAAQSILRTAIDECGINFIDTADVYDNGKSEQMVGRAIKESWRKVYIATKCGRGIVPHDIEHYTVDQLTHSVERSLQRIGCDRIDLIQLHCPPPEVYDRPEFFAHFDTLRQQGKIDKLGVSVETVEQARRSMQYDNVSSIQLIFNIFRQRPADELFADAEKKGVALIVRVPLASGLLTGKIDATTTFAKQDHRAFNRDGKYFDKGETFSGVPFDVGLDAVQQLQGVVTDGMPLPVLALKWILGFSAVSTIIPGASSAHQVVQNVTASDVEEPLSDEQRSRIAAIYKQQIAPHVHHLW